MLAQSLAVLLSAAPGIKIHRHAAEDAGFRANAYLIEVKDGVIAVDAPFTMTESKRFRAKFEALKKPLLGVLVTHAHPDHVNGITTLLQGQTVPVVATAGVEKTLKAIDGPKRAYWTPIYKDEYSKVTTFPSRVVADGETLELGGVKLTARDVGEGESASETVWILNGQAAFVGDLVMNRVHAWLAEGHSGAWLQSLASTERLLGDVKDVYPGHGEPGTRESLAWQKKYLETYRAEVKALARGEAKLTEVQKGELTKKMEAFLPKGPLSMLVRMSADAVAAELAQAPAPHP